jgi:hypothetical protein
MESMDFNKTVVKPLLLKSYVICNEHKLQY